MFPVEVPASLVQVSLITRNYYTANIVGAVIATLDVLAYMVPVLQVVGGYFFFCLHTCLFPRLFQVSASCPPSTLTRCYVLPPPQSFTTTGDHWGELVILTRIYSAV